jgi:hypothetical protein
LLLLLLVLLHQRVWKMPLPRARHAAGESFIVSDPTEVIEASATALIPVRTFLAEFACAERDLERMAGGDLLLPSAALGAAAAGTHSPSTLVGQGAEASSSDVDGRVPPLSAAALVGDSSDVVRLEELVELSADCGLRTVAESKRTGWLSRKGALKLGNVEYVPASKRAKGSTGLHRTRHHRDTATADGDAAAGAAAAGAADKTADSVAESAVGGSAVGGAGPAVVTDGDEVLLTVAFYHQRKPLKLAEFEVRRGVTRVAPSITLLPLTRAHRSYEFPMFTHLHSLFTSICQIMPCRVTRALTR